MKYLFIFLFGLMVSGFSSCSDSADKDKTTQKDSNGKKDDTVAEANLPPAVLSAFKAKYPDATGVEWETAKENDKPTFKAKWKNGNDKMKAEFAEDGSFVKEDKD
jgi:hypothetical protein